MMFSFSLMELWEKFAFLFLLKMSGTDLPPDEEAEAEAAAVVEEEDDDDDVADEPEAPEVVDDDDDDDAGNEDDPAEAADWPLGLMLEESDNPRGRRLVIVYLLIC